MIWGKRNGGRTRAESCGKVAQVVGKIKAKKNLEGLSRGVKLNCPHPLLSETLPRSLALWGSTSVPEFLNPTAAARAYVRTNTLVPATYEFSTNQNRKCHNG